MACSAIAPPPVRRRASHPLLSRSHVTRFALLVTVLIAVPAAAQPTSPLCQASIDAGASPGRAAALAAAADQTEDALLRASNPDANDRFGYSVSVSGDRAVVGAILEDGPTNGTAASGATYAFNLAEAPVTVTQAGLYNPSDPSDGGKGYRLLGAPVPGVSVTDLAALNLVQGVSAGANPAAAPAQYPQRWRQAE